MPRSWSLWWNKVRYTVYTPVYDWIVGSFGPKRAHSIGQLRSGPDAPVLIVGAGTGLDLPYLTAYRQITAIDITPSMLRELEKRARKLNVPVRSRVMDGSRLEFQDGSFEVVILHLILAVMPDPKACMQEVARVLRPGGEVVIFDKFLPDHRRAGVLRRAVDGIARLLATSINRQTKEILEGAGLNVLRDEPAGWGGLFRILYLVKP